jgi:Tfp pilus assembly protein PilN
LVVLGIGRIYINQQVNNLTNNVELSKSQLAAQNLTKVQKQADEITNNIRTINQVLGQEIRFSELIKTIGAVMPPGTVLSSLSLGKVNAGIDLSAQTVDHATAAQVAVNLSDPAKKIFDKVDIINVNCSTEKKAYPCDATYRALFNKNIPSQFLSVPASTTGGSQ